MKESTAAELAAAWVQRDVPEADEDPEIRGSRETSLRVFLAEGFAEPEGWAVLTKTTRPELAIISGSGLYRIGVRHDGFSAWRREITPADCDVQVVESVSFAYGSERRRRQWTFDFGADGIDINTEEPLDAGSPSAEEQFARTLAAAAGWNGLAE